MDQAQSQTHYSTVQTPLLYPPTQPQDTEVTEHRAVALTALTVTATQHSGLTLSLSETDRTDLSFLPSVTVLSVLPCPSVCWL